MGNITPSVNQAEHLGGPGSGENIEAKKSANYVWNGASWQRMSQPGGGFSPVIDYDFIDVEQTSASVETYLFKLGGTGGTLVRTIVVTYVDSTKADIDTVEYS